MSKSDADLEKARSEMELATSRFKEKYEDLQKRIGELLPNSKAAPKPAAVAKDVPVQKPTDAKNFLQKIGFIKSSEH